MKLTVTQEPTPPPPKIYHLELSEDEALFIYRVLNNFTMWSQNDSDAKAACQRLRSKVALNDQRAIDYNKLFLKARSSRWPGN